jgi:hypothetical protein
MAYQSHHYSATLPCSVCLTIFLHTCLALSVLLPFMLYAPCPFNAPFLFCVFQLLHTASFYMPESLSTATLISSLFCILIVSVHLVHAICAILLHALTLCHCSPHRDIHCHSTLPPLHSLEHQHTLFVLHVLLMSSPLPDHHGNSSASLVVIPMCSSSLGVMLRFLSLSSSQDSSSSLS